MPPTSRASRPHARLGALGALAGAVLAACGSSSTPVAVETAGASATGLVAGYAFREGSGSTTADASPNALTGTLRGATWTAGHTGNGLAFDGVSSHLDLGNRAALGITGSLTVSAWVKESANVFDDGIIVAKSSGIAGWELKSSPDTGARTFALGVYAATTGAYVGRYSSAPRVLDTWYHVAGVYDAAARTLHVYVNGALADGALIGTVPAALANPSSVNAHVGRRSAGFHLRGAIDDVRVYARALTLAEIRADMASAVEAGGTTAPFDFTIAGPGSLSVAQGGTVTGTVAAGLASGTSAPVTFAVSGLPAGATGSFSPLSCAPPCTTALSISASPTTPTGATTVTVSGTAGALARTASSTLTVTVDDQPPTGTVLVNGGAAATRSTAVTLTLSATDAVGPVTQMQFSNSGTLWSTPEPYAATKAWTLTSGAGTKTVYARFRDAAGNWSAPATDTIVLDTTPPTISAVAASAITETSAVITWTTSEPATSQVEYGRSTSFGTLTPVDPALVLSHRVVLTGLAAATAYSYRVRSMDSAQNEGLGSPLSFTTTASPDTTPPSTPAGLTASGASVSTVNLAWAASTDNVGVAGYRVYRNGAQIATTPATAYADTGLAPATTYSYAVAAYDAAGNVSPISAPVQGATLSNGGTAAPPVLVQHLSSSTNNQSSYGNNFRFTLPNPVRAGNTLVLGLSHGYSATRRVTIVDSNGNAWPTAPAVTASNGTITSSIYVLPNAKAGVTTITISLDAIVLPFQYDVSEFTGIAPTSPVNGTCGSATTASPNLSCGGFTPGNNDANGGNLVWAYYVDNRGASYSHRATRFAPGAGLRLESANTAWGDQGMPTAVASALQPAAARIDPSMGVTIPGGTDTFNVVAVALRVDRTAGTPPPATGIRIKRSAFRTADTPGAAWGLQFPSDGDLLVAATANGEVFTDITALSDSTGNAWTKYAPEADESQIFVAPGATTGSDLLITVHVSGSSPTLTMWMLDIVGAAPDPVDAVAAFPSTPYVPPGNLVNAPSITPGSPGGLTLAVVMFGLGPTSGFAAGSPPGAYFDSVYYTNEVDDDGMNNADGYAHAYNAGTERQNFNWVVVNGDPYGAPNRLMSYFGTAIHLKSR